MSMSELRMAVLNKLTRFFLSHNMTMELLDNGEDDEIYEKSLNIFKPNVKINCLKQLSNLNLL